MGRAAALVLLACCLLAAGPVRAGAWLPEPGRGFLSLTGTLRHGPSGFDAESSVYSEYGLGPRLAFGFDVNDRPGIAGHALVFLRLPLSPPGARTRLAVDLALGGHYWQTVWDAMSRLTLSAGRDVGTRWGDGWVAVDAAYERRFLFADPAFKLDLTAGLSSGPRLRPILQVETTTIPGREVYWSVTTGLMLDGPGGTWLIGLERKSPPLDSIGVKIALWRRF